MPRQRSWPSGSWRRNDGRCSRRLREAQIKPDMRGHVAELLANSVQSRQLDVRLSSEDQMLLD